MRQRLLVGAFCTLMLFWASPARTWAQTITTAVLQGEVRDQANVVMTGVSVILRATEGGGSRMQMTSREGTFRFGLLLPGTYSVLVERFGYRPKRIENVRLHAGRSVRIDVLLQAAPPPVEAADVSAFGRNPGATRSGVSQAVTVLSPFTMPWNRRETGELAGLATSATPRLEIEGLPAQLGAIVIDGVRYTPAQHSQLSEEHNQVAALSFGSVGVADLVTADADQEWSGFSSGALAIQTRRGGPEFSAQAFGSWAGSALSSSKFFDASSVSQNSLMGGLLLGGPIIRDTAHFAIGLEARRVDSPHARAWDIDSGSNDALIAAGQAAHGVALDAYAQPFVAQRTDLSGFGRFDWQLAAQHGVSVRAGLARLGSIGGAADVAQSAVPGLAGEGSDVLMSASIASTFRETWTNEVRVGFTRSTREYLGSPTLDGAQVPSTRIVDTGAHFGIDPRLPGLFERSGFSVLEVLEIPINAHRAKLGLELDVGSHDATQWFARSGEFAFGGVTQFAGAEGAFYQITGAARPVGFSSLRYGAFLQDSWSATPEVTVVAGVRYDVEVLPADDFRSSAEWTNLSGLPVDTIDETVGTLSPRIGLVWDVGGRGNWYVRATAGTFASFAESEFLTELIAGPRTVRRGFGSFGSWPAADQQAPEVGEMISIAGPEYRGPLTVRTGIGISRRVGTSTMLHVSGAYRTTDFLTRRSDLNLLTSRAGEDQHGRPIYGTLQKSGGLVSVARPNRRFSDFDRVSALTADGSSRYWGITVGLEREFNRSFGYFAKYTYSRTTDDWLGARNGAPDAQLTPFPEDVVDWREGRSDYDLPHRVAAGVEIRSQGAFRPLITAIYSYRSGYPFTPGFREGLDVNGDGSSRNDPAFVDEAIAGVAELIGSWDCLRDQVGRFVERNACRQPGVHSLNARVGISIAASSRFSAQIYADAINLIESSIGEPDRALFLVNPAAGLVFDQATGTVTLPLVANPHFGEPIVRTGAGRTLRIGLQVNH